MEEATAENGSGQSVKHSRIRSDPGPLVHTYVSTSIDGTGKFVPYF